MTEDWRNGGFGLYIHWPFCAAKCPYCDFNSHVSTQIDQTQWANAYLSEIDRLGRETQGRTLNTVFFGGGTPSLMDPDLVGAILTKVRQTWPMVNDPEITLEANPTSIESGRFRAFFDAGVNRVSMGMQALNDDDLRRLGRMHSVAEGQRAFDIARDTFERVSFDLIYARQHQTPDDWRRELSEALTMAADHLSLYQLTIEPGTVFGARHDMGQLRGLPVDDSAADMYLITQEVCESHGLPAYEVSNHARPGSESRHNLIYWRYGDYLGIGPGAHGRITQNGRRFATDTAKAPAAWLDQVARTGSGELSREALDDTEQAIEYLLFSMRLTEGLDAERYVQISGQPLSPSALSHLEDLGMITQEQDRIRATKEGRPVLNAIIRELLP
ncbi:coproporphyrinogen III oxidase [Thioclava dalianensis]|uniref:Heme chaperone HemW n=1 Tax=Thioclava dalianensis TaxID=1185766 RepID=A0A074TAX1_9RHOB|nr:radical SAM family heme chaperone HemW [Thioclava dalianensis]KEP68936.1 coproporphyrinogen III oxidase [Thioclava dalianensis]SFN34893.1 oxygen-independent coproporphyrinogen-3 oxidase [Thioclava dalianensis]